jgi:hypothetical protein
MTRVTTRHTPATAGRLAELASVAVTSQLQQVVVGIKFCLE